MLFSRPYKYVVFLNPIVSLNIPDFQNLFISIPPHGYYFPGLNSCTTYTKERPVSHHLDLYVW